MAEDERGRHVAQAVCSYFTYHTPHGPITISASARGIRALAFSGEDQEGKRCATALSNEAANQLQEYFAGKRREFSVPLDLAGSAFQKKVWTQACLIPYGQACTAAELAEAIGSPGAHRSVGTALRRNPAPILVPAHRVELPGSSGRAAKICAALRALEAKYA